MWAITHFYYYLYGHQVTLFTDHFAVKTVLETPNPTGRLWTHVYEIELYCISFIRCDWQYSLSLVLLTGHQQQEDCSQVCD